MAVTATELWGRRISDDTAEFGYRVDGTNDPATAKTAAKDQAETDHGLIYDTKVLNDAELVEVRGLDSFTAVVTYGAFNYNPQEGDTRDSFDTRGGSSHITQSKENISKTAPVGVTAPDYKGAIGVSDSGVAGADIIVPVFGFNKTRWFDPDDVDSTYQKLIGDLTGKTNDAAFFGWAIGEVLFLGAVGTQNGTDPWQIDFAFAASDNLVGLSIGDIAGVSKKAWEYLWIRYQTVEDAAAKMLVAEPLGAYVERVYDDGDFSDLGIGVA